MGVSIQKLLTIFSPIFVAEIMIILFVQLGK